MPMGKCGEGEGFILFKIVGVRKAEGRSPLAMENGRTTPTLEGTTSDELHSYR